MNRRVFALRKTLNLTLEDFGKRIGVNKTSVSCWESGRRNLSEQSIRSICREFEVNESWLRSGVGEMFIQHDSEFVSSSSESISGRLKNRIKYLRKELNMTQQQFADNLGIKRNTIATYESGRNEPIDAVIALICKTFNVNEYWLRNGSGDVFITMDRENRIAQWATTALKNEPDSFKSRFIRALSFLNEDEWEVLAKIAQQITDGGQTELSFMDNLPNIANEEAAYASYIKNTFDFAGNTDSSPLNGLNETKAKDVS